MDPDQIDPALLDQAEAAARGDQGSSPAPAASSNGLNDQGFGAVAMPGLSYPSQPQQQRQSLRGLLGLGGQQQQPGGMGGPSGYSMRFDPRRGWMPGRASWNQQALSGGSAAGGYGAMPANPNPWIMNQIDQAERALDVLTEQHGQGKIGDQQLDFGQQKLQKYMNRIDPGQQYRRDGLLRTQTPMDKFMAQQTHLLRDPQGNERGIVMLDGKGTPHFHEFKRDDTDWHKQQLEQRDQFHQHSMDILKERLEWEKDKLQRQLNARDQLEQSRQASKNHDLEISKAVSKTAVDIFNAHAHDQEVSLGKDSEGNDKKQTKRVYGKTMEEAHAMARKLHGLPDLPPMGQPAGPAGPEAAPAEPSDAAKQAAQEVLDKAAGRKPKFELNSLPSGYHAPL